MAELLEPEYFIADRLTSAAIGSSLPRVVPLHIDEWNLLMMLFRFVARSNHVSPKKLLWL